MFKKTKEIYMKNFLEKMQFNVPRKITSRIQVWLSVFLIVLSLVFAFTPMISLETVSPEENAMLNEIIDMANKEGVDFDLEITETVNISMPDLVKAISAIGKVVKNKDSSDELVDYLRSESGQKTILMSLSIVHMFTDMFGNKDAAESAPDTGIVGTLLKGFASLIALFYVLTFIMIFPIFYAVTAISIVMSAVSNLQTPESVASKVNGKVIALISYPMLFILAQNMLPTMHIGIGAIMMFVSSIAAALLAFVVTRLRKYTLPQLKYLTLLQGTALVSFIAFIIFFVNLLNAEVFGSFISGDILIYTGEVIALKAISENAQASSMYLVDLFCILIYLGMALSVSKYLIETIKRLTCTAKNESAAFTAVTPLLTAILPLFVMLSKHNYTNFKDATDGAESFLQLENSGAVYTMLVCAIIMFSSEIIFKILKKSLCTDITSEEVIGIYTGVLSEHKDNKEPAKEEPSENKPSQEATPDADSAEKSEETVSAE